MKNEKFIKRWEKEKQKGKMRYVLSRMIIMGAGMSVGSSISFILREGWANPIEDSFFLLNTCTFFIGGCIGGAIGSLIGWGWNVEKYSRLIEHKEIEVD